MYDTPVHPMLWPQDRSEPLWQRFAGEIGAVVKARAGEVKYRVGDGVERGWSLDPGEIRPEDRFSFRNPNGRREAHVVIEATMHRLKAEAAFESSMHHFLAAFESLTGREPLGGEAFPEGKVKISQKMVWERKDPDVVDKVMSWASGLAREQRIAEEGHLAHSWALMSRGWKPLLRAAVEADRFGPEGELSRLVMSLGRAVLRPEQVARVERVCGYYKPYGYQTTDRPLVDDVPLPSETWPRPPGAITQARMVDDVIRAVAWSHEHRGARQSFGHETGEPPKRAAHGLVILVLHDAACLVADEGVASRGGGGAVVKAFDRVVAATRATP